MHLKGSWVVVGGEIEESVSTLVLNDLTSEGREATSIPPILNRDTDLDLAPPTGAMHSTVLLLSELGDI